MKEIADTIPQRAPSVTHACFHCGLPIGHNLITADDKQFCCRGCLTVYELLTENGLAEFYQLGNGAGVRIESSSRKDDFKFLDEPEVLKRLISFADDRISRVTFRLPAIHCIACVWLLENLFRLRQGIGRCEVNFPRKEIVITFEHAQVSLGEVASLLASLGYAPDLNFSDLDAKPRPAISRRLWMQLAVAGFAFGNAMLFSIPTYLGLDTASAQRLAPVFGWLNLILAVPVLIYSAADYWTAAIAGLRQRRLTIEVPLVLGIVALFAQSAFTVVVRGGEGYFDSFCGLLFFLLCGKAFQQKTYDRLVFERDYKSFFPLSVMRKVGDREQKVALSQLRCGDKLIVRNGELIPADARLISGAACIDYSFVTGESRPVTRTEGDHLYCGGRQVGGAIEIELLKEVSQSHLSSLWNQEAFRKKKDRTFDNLTNRYSERFTRMVIAVAIGAGIFWWFHAPSIAFRSFTAVLIVACPCALALAAPFALGTAQRILARRGVFLKSAQVVESLARVDTVVFDKTGTLTTVEAAAPAFDGTQFTPEEIRCIAAVTTQSTHPYSARILKSFDGAEANVTVRSFAEVPGCGIEGMAGGRQIRFGSAAWFASTGIILPELEPRVEGSEVLVAINGEYRGRYMIAGGLRPEIEFLAKRLAPNYELALISGDNDRERVPMQKLFGPRAPLRFNQSPLDKLNFVRGLQQQGNIVMMAGDGLNDAGALQQSDVGVAVVEDINAFSPASDVIMKAEAVPQLETVMRFAKSASRVVQWSFFISSLYNIVGITIAARGLLSPVVCAILMPLSSVTVVAFACGTTAWLGLRSFSRMPVSAKAGNLSSNPNDLQLAIAGEGGAA